MRFQFTCIIRSPSARPLLLVFYGNAGRVLVTDERALVLAARNLGFVFKTRLPDCVSIEVVRAYIEILNKLHVHVTDDTEFMLLNRVNK